MTGITHTTAKYVLKEMYRTGKSALEIVEEQDLWQLDYERETDLNSPEVNLKEVA